MIHRFLIAIVIFAAMVLSAMPSLTIAAEDELLGAGATFPYPLYSKMFDIYHKKTNVRVNYQSIGSGGGIRQLFNKTVDFGATDSFLTDEEHKKAPADILHVPICLGAVAITYNLPNNPELRITPEVLADIFLGKITTWNSPSILEHNPGVELPAMKIAVVHRSDGSGTTFIFTDFLSKVSAEWETKVSRGKSVNWRTGIGAKGNEGVAGLIKQIPGSIGYVELAYTIQNNMPRARIKNKSGNFIAPELNSTSLAGNTDIPQDTRITLTNTDAPEGYPISGFTWIIVYKEQNYDSRTRGKALTLVKLLDWMIHDGQTYTSPLMYAPLPEEAVDKAEKIIRSIMYDGKPVLE